MSIDVSKKSVRLDIIEQIKTDDNKKRKATSLRQFRVYNDNLDQYVQERLLQAFSKETFNMMPMISTINIAKRIINKSSSIYNNPPNRTFVNATDEQSDILSSIYKNSGFNNKLMKSNRYYTMQGQNHLYLKLVNGKFVLLPLLGHNIDCIPLEDNPEESEGYVITNFNRTNYINSPNNYAQLSSTGFQGTSDAGYLNPGTTNMRIADRLDFQATAERYTFWTNEFNFVCDGNGNIIGDEKSIENDIGMIPILDISQTKDNTYFIEKGSGVIDFCIDYNVAFSDLMFITRLQGFSQGVVSGDKEVLDKMTSVQLGPAHLIKLPNGPSTGTPTKLDFVSRGSDIKGSQESINMLVSSFLSAESQDPKTISTNGDTRTYASGFDRFLAMIDQYETSKSDYDLYSTVEVNLFNILKTYLNVYSGTEFIDPKYKTTLSDDASVIVNFKSPELIESDAEKTETMSKKIDVGILSKIEAIMLDRGVERNKAEEIYNQIKSDSGLVL